MRLKCIVRGCAVFIFIIGSTFPIKGWALPSASAQVVLPNDAYLMYYFESQDLPASRDQPTDFVFLPNRNDLVTVFVYGLDPDIWPILRVLTPEGDLLHENLNAGKQSGIFFRFRPTLPGLYRFSVASFGAGTGLVRVMLFEGEPLEDDLTLLDTLNPLLPSRAFMVAGNNFKPVRTLVETLVIRTPIFQFRPILYTSRGTSTTPPPVEERHTPLDIKEWFNEDGSTFYTVNIRAIPEDGAPPSANPPFSYGSLGDGTYFYYLTIGAGSDPVVLVRDGAGELIEGVLRPSSSNLLIVVTDPLLGGPNAPRVPVIIIDPETQTVTVDGTTIPPEALECNLISGTDGDDRGVGGELVGTPQCDLITGAGGNDVLKGRGETDYLLGGLGHDELYGEGGNDFLYGDPDKAGENTGEDLLYGGDGDDYLDGGGGDDILYGQDGEDRLFGRGGDDILYGGEDDDLLYGGPGNDHLYGDEENDTLYGGTEDDLLDGGAGNDILYGEAGDDILNGDENNDTLYGGDGDDQMDGGNGNDTLFVENASLGVVPNPETITGGAGADSFVFVPTAIGRFVLSGDPSDTLNFSALNRPITINLGLTGVDQTVATNLILHLVTVFNRIFGTNFNDTIIGTNGNDFINANGGDDLVRGLGGNDTIDGGAGNDTLYGGMGADTLIDTIGNNTIFGGKAAGELCAGGDGNDTITVGGGVNTVFGSNENNNTFCNDGADHVIVLSGVNLVIGGNRNNGLGAVGNDGNDNITLNGLGTDTVFGGNLNLSGGVGTDGGDFITDNSIGGDIIHGGNQNFSAACNLILGNCNDGNDTITLNAGSTDNDRVFGGNQNFNGAGNDVGDLITDHSTGNDHIYGGNDNSGLGPDGGDGNDTINSNTDGTVMDILVGDNLGGGGTGADTINGTPFFDVVIPGNQ
jgi:Ca2+-binding RTX toxin-like protein